MRLINSKQNSDKVSGPASKARTFKSRPIALRTEASKIEMCGAALETLLKRPFLAVEIGCGVGLHPIKYATEFPDRAIIAIERTSDKYSRFARRVATHKDLHSRLCGVHADAFQFMDEVIPDLSVDEVWILYPNPEPKKASRRWFHTPFTSRLTEFLKPGAKIFLATNIESYAADCEELAPAFGLAVTQSNRVRRKSHPAWQPRTHFEKKYFERDETLFDLEFTLKSCESLGARR